MRYGDRCRPSPASIMRTASLSSTAPGITGLPGKWPSAAAWSAGKVCFRTVKLARLGDQRVDALARQLAGLVARQLVDQAQRPRQERRVDALAQRREDRIAGEPWRDRERGEPRDRLLAGGRHHERAVAHAGDGIQVVVEARERGALARDVDQIGGAAVQDEAARAAALD